MGMVQSLVAISAEDAGRVRAGSLKTWALLDGEGGIDLDKAWQGLHFLLCGDAWGGEGPLADALMGGEEIGEELGYGKARYLEPAAARAVHEALSALSEHALRERFDPEAFLEEEIYPEIWEEPDAVDYPLSYFEPLRAFYADAAGRGLGVLMAVT
jgi:hypothetical protein